MNVKDDDIDRTAQLRFRAEEIDASQGNPSAEELAALTFEERLRVLQELSVHQIELKMQNEELRRVQVELEAARARYFDLYNRAPVGYFIISREGLILEANLAAISLLGLTRAEMIKQPISRYILEKDLTIYYRHRIQLWETGEPDACDLRMVRRDGTTFWVRVTATVAQAPMTSSGQDTGGKSVSRVVLSDIAEFKRVEEEKAELEAQIRQAQRHRPTGARKKQPKA